MLHPLFSVLIQRPELLAEHIAGYAALVQEDAAAMTGDLRVRLIAAVAALLLLGVFLVLAGVAVMLGFVLDRFHWALLVAPGVALAGGLAAVVMAQRTRPVQRFAEVKAQLGEDLALLRAAGGQRD